MKNLKLLFCLFVIFSTVSFATTPIKVALLTPIELPAGQDVTGLSLNVLYGHTSSVSGLELGMFVNHTDNMLGIQYSNLANISKNLTGIQLGTVNAAEGVGIQMGVVNYSKQLSGLQIGLINYAERLQGLQLGLANINFSGPIPIFPFINFSFSF